MKWLDLISAALVSAFSRYSPSDKSWERPIRKNTIRSTFSSILKLSSKGWHKKVLPLYHITEFGNLEVTDNFIYLGTIFSFNNNVSLEGQRRITISNRRYFELSTNQSSFPFCYIVRRRWRWQYVMGRHLEFLREMLRVRVLIVTVAEEIVTSYITISARCIWSELKLKF